MIKANIARAGLIALLASASMFTISAAQAGSYSFNTYNNPGDTNFNQLLGINNAGTIGGYFGDGAVVPNNGYTFVRPSTYTAENFPSSVQTQVVGINNLANTITVGFYIDAAGDNVGFWKQGSTYNSVSNPSTPSSPPPSVNQLLGVNDSGVAAGFYNDSAGFSHGYTYNTGSNTFTPVTPPPAFGALSVQATGINNLGEIAGFFADSGGAFHGFLDNGGSFTKLDDPNGTNTQVFGLNNEGQAVGTFVDGAGETQGFVYNAGTYMTISDPNASGTPAFGVTGTFVNGINDHGDLVGFYSDGTNVNGFVATPGVPEPATWALMLLGFAGLSAATMRTRRRLGAVTA